MHRFAVATLSAIALASALFVGTARADTPTILVDGVVVRTDVPPLVVDGHVLVPLRGVFERFGADVSYDPNRNLAVAQRYGTVVKVAVGTPDAWINGSHVSLEVPAREFGGRVEVPLRFVADALGVSVDYDAPANTVVLVSGLRQGNFVAAISGGPSITSVAENAYANASAPAVGPSLSDEKPAPNSLVGTQYPQIYARLGGGSSAVDPATVRVLLDGADVTNSATVSSAYVAYTPAQALDGGSHTVEISGQADDGAGFDEQWSFRIESDMSSGYIDSVIGYAPPAFGYPQFGFSPPGFSLFAPGPQFFVEDEPIIIVFFSPFFPNGNGFFTVSGVPGQFGMTPWLGCPGFFWGTFNVPQGVFDPEAVVGAHFTTSGGRIVVVHSTAPLHIDGTRKTLPSTMHFAVRARLVNRPSTPRSLVAFRRIEPAVRLLPISRRIAMPVSSRTPAYMRIPVRTVTVPTARQIAPVQIPRVPVVTAVPRVEAPAPVLIPVRSVAPAQQPAPQPVMIPKKPPQ